MVNVLERVKMSVKDYVAKLSGRGIAPDGKFIPDPVPVAPPIGFKRQPSMVEMVREMVRSERLRSEVEAAGLESFEEADDFDVEEDVQLHSPYENDFDPPVKELLKEGSAELSRKAREKAAKSSAGVPPADGPGGSSRRAGGQPSARERPAAEQPEVDLSEGSRE